MIVSREAVVANLLRESEHNVPVEKMSLKECELLILSTMFIYLTQLFAIYCKFIDFTFKMIMNFKINDGLKVAFIISPLVTLSHHRT